METGEEAPLAMPYPPEGVEWHNRWAELENAYALLEKQNQSLQKQVSDLKGALHEKLQEPPATEDTELRQKLQEQVDLLLTEEVRKEEKIARFAKELEEQTGKMSELSRAKFQLEYEKSRTESEILPIKAERDRLQSEKQMKDRIIDDLRKELASSRDEQDKLFREKFEMARDLRRQLQAEKAAASYQQQMAEEALQAQYREKKLKEELERKVKDLQEDFANKKAALEDQRRISDDRAQRMDENWKTAQAQLAETVADLKSACEVRDEMAMELQMLKTELEEQRQQYQRLSQEHEDFLRRRIPGADTGELPNGYESLTELVRIAHTSRQEALQERAAKENLQKVLQDIEREIRQRYPVLMSQNQELKELRAQNAEMKEQNRIIYQKAREYATYNRDAEARAQRAEHAYTIADLHAHDLTKQLAVLLHDKNRWSNASLAASRATFFQMTKAAEEEGEWPLSSVQDVVQQNVALRKALRQLEARCQEEDAKEKEAMEDREQQLEGELEKKAEELQELTSQLQELKDAVEDVSRHRDAALRKVKTLEAAQAALPPRSTGSEHHAAQAPAEDPKLQRLAAREEELRTQVLELQKSSSQASCALATAEAKLDFERQRRGDAEESSKQLKREVKEVQERVNQQAKFIEDLREEKCIEERKLREAQHTLQSAQSSKGEVESMLKAEESKVSTLEKSHAVLQTEKQLLEREVAALQVRTSQERESLKRDLEEQYKKQEDLVLNLSKKSQEDMQRLEATLRESREQAAQATQRAKEEQIAKLEAKLAAAQREIERRSGFRSSAEVVAEAETQLDRSEHMMDQLMNPEQRGDVRLAQVAEREEQHRKTVETWKKLLAQQSAELRDSKAEQERLEEEVNSLKAKFQEEREKIEEASQRDKVKASELAVRLDETRTEVLGLKSQVEASNVELETAKLDWEQKLRDSTEQLSCLERERKDLQDQVQKAEQKYQEEVKLHATDAKELGSAHERLTELDRSCLQLKHQVADLERETLRAREERKEELSSARKRMEQAERHAENLSEENARYRDQMVALSRGIESSEQASSVLLEMKQARELGEVERRKLELQKTQIEEDAKAVRAENQSLREQLANEQRENWRLQKDCQLETQSRAKLLQIDMIEDENCRLEAENKIMKSKLEEAEKKADATTNPLVEQLEVAKKRTGEVESELKQLKSKADEWKSMYEACKFKEDDIKKWEVQQAELKSNVTSLEEKIGSLQGKLEEEQKICKEEKSKVQDLTKARDALQGTLKTKEAEFNKQASALKAVQGIKELHTRRLHELEAETKKLKEENQRHKEPEEVKQLQKRVHELEAETKKLKEENQRHKEPEEVKQLQKRVHELEAETKKLKEENQRHKEPEEVKQLQKRVHELEAETKKMKEENQRLKDPEEVKQLQRHADTALHLAMEYRTAMEVLLPEVEKRADAARPIAPAAAAPATAPGTAPATNAPPPTAASPAQKETTAQKETSSVESKDAAKEAKRPAVPGALGQATAQPKPAQPAAPEARTAAPPAVTTTTTSVVPPATPVVPKESPESAPAKRKEQPVQQPGQVERAAKTARSEGPPVKKQPVPAKAPAASGGAPASTTTAAAPASAATPPTTPAPSPALTPRAAPIEIMDVDEEPPKPSS
ncbi:unnamed protein product [Cladocopium goreaui]|uniref:Nucleoprotein TPR n=1 Tax=Cladocopium goreaui TaxID=2562237 RepID=A0A9P1BJ62_9DINO|nr:unnamed protein product [Cladocopium goreaui]